MREKVGAVTSAAGSRVASAPLGTGRAPPFKSRQTARRTVVSTRTMSERAPYEDLREPSQMEAVMAADAGPAVIDFWSPTCGPCQSLAPHFEAVAREFVGSALQFYKVNTAEAPALAAAFSIRSVPTLIFVHRGEVLDAVVGSMPPQRLLARSQWLLKKSENKGIFARLLGR